MAPLAFLGLPSVQSIVEGIVSFFFSDLADALVPGFLKEASVATIKWLVAVPDPTAWAHVSALQGELGLIAASALAVSFTAAIVRHLIGGLGGASHPMQALSSTLASAGMMVAYGWAAGELVAMVNTLTDAILSFPVVGEGLQRTVGVIFGGALTVGSGGVFLALLVIVGVVFATVMFALKVLVLLAFALLFVTGPLLIALRPLPELSHLARAWGTAVVGVAIVPVGWTILFATAGALSLDATSFGTGGASGLTGHLAGALAALLTFYLAIKLPLGVFSHLRGALAAVSPGGGRTSGASGGGPAGAVTRVGEANARLRASTLGAGRNLGAAAGALGAPAGGPAGLAGRAAGRLGAPLGKLASVASEQTGGLGGRLSQSRAGRALASTPVAQAAGRRAGAAKRALAGEAPQRPGAASPRARDRAAVNGDRAGERGAGWAPRGGRAVAGAERGSRAGREGGRPVPASATEPRPGAVAGSRADGAAGEQRAPGRSDGRRGTGSTGQRPVREQRPAPAAAATGTAGSDRNAQSGSKGERAETQRAPRQPGTAAPRQTEGQTARRRAGAEDRSSGTTREAAGRPAPWQATTPPAPQQAAPARTRREAAPASGMTPAAGEPSGAARSAKLADPAVAGSATQPAASQRAGGQPAGARPARAAQSRRPARAAQGGRLARPADGGARPAAPESGVRSGRPAPGQRGPRREPNGMG
ncbi:MAG: hypothetical protein ACYCXW_00775 [Solirubrobacteraceae bacterium]